MIRTCIGNVCRSHDPSNLLHGLKIGAKTTMHSENLLIDDGSNGQAVEAIRKCLPEFDVVASFTCMYLAQRVMRQSAEGTNIRHKSHKCGLCWRIRGYRGE